MPGDAAGILGRWGVESHEVSASSVQVAFPAPAYHWYAEEEASIIIKGMQATAYSLVSLLVTWEYPHHLYMAAIDRSAWVRRDRSVVWAVASFTPRARTVVRRPRARIVQGWAIRSRDVSPQVFVGIDVAKAQLDIALRPLGERWAVTNDDAGIAALVMRLQAMPPS